MNRPRVLISHPTGNQNVRNALESLAEREMLAEFWTTVAWDAQSGWNRLLPSGLRTLLERRAFREAPRERVKCVPWREMVRLSVGSTPLNSFLTSGERPFSIIGVYRHFDGKVARRVSSLHPDAVYAYEGGALETFREARRLGITTIYEQASSYWYWVRDLLKQEAERSPAFAGLLPNLADSTKHLEWKDEELSLADYVFVASEHVRRTLAGVVPEGKIRVVHYGAPAIRRREQIATDAARPLRVLFVGVLVQHKGIGYLLDAIDRLGAQVELTLVGRRFQANARVDEACRRWRWFETLPHSQVLDVMMESDVLVLPSLGEGFGMVVTEALACGLPVIVTPHVGASDLVQDGREGFVVPVCSADAIVEHLQILNRDRELLAAMSRRAQATAADQSWMSYRTNFADTLGAVAACK
ncbi:MAG: glycosyltransferase family 4 protein [Terracidiphilus sp.]|jgi:glycosyltransferase involved in cell wall biosynthesis